MTFLDIRPSCFFVIAVVLLTGCKAYKQDILFNLGEDYSAPELRQSVAAAESNYQLRPDDVVQLEVYTNKGERLVDPNFELSAGMDHQNIQFRDRYQYLIQTDGMVKLPIVGRQKLEGLTIDQAESLLEEAYNTYYKESFVKLRIINKRVVVLGANGGQVIPIPNENTSLVEVIALYGGLNLGANAQNIRVIRGDLRHPEVYLVDLSTIEGMQQSVVSIEAGDIIYIEPWRRPFLESLKDVSPVLSLVSSVFTLIVVVQNL